MIRLSFLSAALLVVASPARASDATPYQLVAAYLHELGTLEDDRAKAEKDQSDHPGDFAACIRDSEALGLELDTASKLIGEMRIHTGSNADDAPQYVANFLLQKREAINQFGQICAQFINGPKAGVDYDSLTVEAPKITAKIGFIDKSLFQTSVLIFSLLIDQKADSQGHASHLTINHEQRDDLIATINAYFAKRLAAGDQGYATSTADLFRTKLNEFACSDDPWK